MPAILGAFIAITGIWDKAQVSPFKR